MREERKVKKWEEETKMERNKEDLLREEENTQKSDEKKKEKTEEKTEEKQEIERNLEKSKKRHTK